MKNDTVCAVMTPLFSGATGAVRVSGPDAFRICGKIFSVPLADKPGHTLHVGTVFDSSGRPLDEAVASVYRAPKSFTGEDVVEFSCHGSLYILDALIKSLIANGARQALRGEFSKRAFINGKMDISQAQGIIDLIEAESETEARIAYRHLTGGISKAVEDIRGDLLAVTAQILAYIDYPDDEIADVSPERLKNEVCAAKEKVSALKNSFSSGRLIKEGLIGCLCGKPNVGKSMLLNRLTGFNRSIVTSVAGTTRDLVEEKILVGGIKIALWDTAGIRDTEDEVEKIGVSLAEKKARQANVILALFDGMSPLDREDEELLSFLKTADGVKIAVLNKDDLCADGNGCFAENEAVLQKTGLFSSVCQISAKTGAGIPELKEAMTALLGKIDPDSGEIVTDERQYQCLVHAEEALIRAEENIFLTPDAILEDMEEAIGALGTVVGKSVGEEVIETIFSRFCVGK